MNKLIAPVKKFVAERKTQLAVTTILTLAGAVVLQQIGLKQHDNFLKEHDLYDAFYNMTEED